MEAKSFAVGVRIEHPQKMINLSQYGQPKVKELGAASYKLTHQLENGRGIYSFCMCPGGYVVNASSEEGRLAVNGMSYRSRDSKMPTVPLYFCDTGRFPKTGSSAFRRSVSAEIGRSCMEAGRRQSSTTAVCRF